MNAKSYTVTCDQCGQADKVWIDDRHIITWDSCKDIISGRYRLDLQWGWQCLCGNNDLVTEQEKKEIKNLQIPDPQDISKVLDNLIPDKPKFKMIAT